MRVARRRIGGRRAAARAVRSRANFDRRFGGLIRIVVARWQRIRLYDASSRFLAPPPHRRAIAERSMVRRTDAAVFGRLQRPRTEDLAQRQATVLLLESTDRTGRHGASARSGHLDVATG